MDLTPRSPAVRGPADAFTGEVWFEARHRGPEPGGMRLNAVRFAPAARTAWHTHGRGQTLHVTDGAALVVTRAGQVAVLGAGDTAWCPPGEEHWHGAGPNGFMTHLAIMAGDDPVWGDHVTDAEYASAA